MKSLRILLAALAALSFVGCSQSEPKTVEQKYDQAIELMDKGQYSLATPVLLEVINENPGTRYATYAHLKLGDAWLAAGESDEDYISAKTQYSIFLNNSPGSHLVPYVMSRLIEVSYRRNISMFFSDEYAFSRDPGHFRDIIEEFKRFYLLYPDSLYLEDSKQYLSLAERALAVHEEMIGDWYFKERHYHSAIARYTYTLKHYPNYEGRQQVLEKLIRAYKKNQQPERAQEMESVYLARFGQ